MSEIEERVVETEALNIRKLSDTENLEDVIETRKKELDELFEKENDYTIKKEEKEIDKILGSFYGFYCGDAKGVPYEFLDRNSINNVPKEMIGNVGVHNKDVGIWSDDTSLVLATEDSIIESNEINYKNIMDKMLNWYTKNEYTADGDRFDIGRTTRHALEDYKKHNKYNKCGKSGVNDNGNGSLMRMLPIAIYLRNSGANELQKVEAVYYSSGLTHAHTISLCGCKIYIDLIESLLDGYTVEEFLDECELEDYSEYYEDNAYYYMRLFNGRIKELTKEEVKSSGFVVYTLEAAIWSVLNTNSYDEAIDMAISLGGDTDTIAAVTGSIAGIIYGYKNIPEEWLNSLKGKEQLDKITQEYVKSIMNLKKNSNIKSK